ncbi:MAG TPA: orotidine-5'-phosphate decarboxylase [Thermoplasmataceae archaeon]|nr:orotidine-5'-phosphate decarboxylase [Thermoplasmataceae archaeon]
MSNDPRLIIALDVYDLAKAINIASETADICFAFKVNWPLVMNSGVGAISELSRFGRVICDFKLADIPNTNTLITDRARSAGAWGIISHSAVGEDSLRAVVKSAKSMKVFSVVYMSHPGWSDIMGDSLSRLISISRSAGVDGLIGPGNEPDVLRKIRQYEKQLPILAPGIGAQGGSPLKAIQAGADYIIVGRSIYSSDDPRRSAMALLDDISGAGPPERILE